MTRRTGQVAERPKYREGRLYFRMWEAKVSIMWDCTSTNRFKVDNPNFPADKIQPRDEVEVIGEEQGPGAFHFDGLRMLKRAEQSANQ